MGFDYETLRVRAVEARRASEAFDAFQLALSRWGAGQRELLEPAVRELLAPGSLHAPLWALADWMDEATALLRLGSSGGLRLLESVVKPDVMRPPEPTSRADGAAYLVATRAWLAYKGLPDPFVRPGQTAITLTARGKYMRPEDLGAALRRAGVETGQDFRSDRGHRADPRIVSGGNLSEHAARCWNPWWASVPKGLRVRTLVFLPDPPYPLPPLP